VHWPWFINNIPLVRDEFRNENSLQDATWLLHYCVELDKARRVRSNDSILSYSTFFRAYELHTKVIYLRNSFRFDFKWRELTADLPGYAYHRVERETERNEKSSDVHRFPRGVEKRSDITREVCGVSFGTVSFLTDVSFSERYVSSSPFVPLDPIVLTIRSRWSDHASFVTRPIALRRSLREWYST